MSSSLQQTLTRLRQIVTETEARRAQLVSTAERDGRSDLSASETAEFRSLTSTIDSLNERIADITADIKRSGRGDPEVDQIRNVTALSGGDNSVDTWARRTADALRRELGGGNEKRAIISGSVDVPALLPLPVNAIPHPTRITDLLVNRQQVDGFAYETYTQTTRVNLAAPVADLGEKPVSTLTVKAVQDRCRVWAHLSEPVPYRIWTSNESISRWLIDEMAAGLLDAIEGGAINGTGAGELPVGVLGLEGMTTPSDRTHVPWTTDLPTTLRSAVTALQNIGEHPTGWALNPADAQAVDLLRWGSAGGLLVGGYENTGPVAQSLLSDNIFGPTRPRVVSPSIPQGTAVLADWNQLKLFVNGTMQIFANAFGDTLFQTNAVQVRAEMHVGINVLRPKAFAIVDLTA